MKPIRLFVVMAAIASTSLAGCAFAERRADAGDDCSASDCKARAAGRRDEIDRSVRMQQMQDRSMDDFMHSGSLHP